MKRLTLTILLCLIMTPVWAHAEHTYNVFSFAAVALVIVFMAKTFLLKYLHIRQGN